MPVNKVSLYVPSENAALTRNARPPAPMSGKNSFAEKLAAGAQNAPVAQEQDASKTLEAPPSAEEKAEALREIMRNQSMMFSQQILASSGSGPKIDSE